MSSFTRPLRHQRDGNKFTIIDPLAFHCVLPETPWRDAPAGSEVVVTVPVGFYGDGASIPWWVRFVLVLTAVAIRGPVGVVVAVLAVAVGHPFGYLLKAAVLHDYLYNSKELPRWAADFVFREAAKVDSARSAFWSPNPVARVFRWLMRWAAWAAVRVWGFVTWNREEPRRVDPNVAAEVTGVLHDLAKIREGFDS